MLTAIALICLLQDSAFESEEFGVRLKIPSDWTVGAARQSHVMLRLNKSGNYPFKPELVIYEVRTQNPVTLRQYREILRHYIQRVLREPRILDDRDAQAAGRPGFLFTAASKTGSGVDATALKGIYMISPLRLLAVDGTFPSGDTRLVEEYAKLAASIELFARKHASADRNWMANYDKAVKDLVPASDVGTFEEKLDIMVSGKKMGEYRFSVKPATDEGTAGLELTVKTALDQGEAGKVESTVRGFLSDDLSRQTVELEEAKRGSDKRGQWFTARSTLAGGKVKVERRINGEVSTDELEVPANAVLAELSELLQLRLAKQKELRVAVPTLAAFANEISYIKIEGGGLHKMRVGEETLEVYVTFFLGRDGALRTFWYDKALHPVRVTTAGQAVIFRRP